MKKPSKQNPDASKPRPINTATPTEVSMPKSTAEAEGPGRSASAAPSDDVGWLYRVRIYLHGQVIEAISDDEPIPEVGPNGLEKLDLIPYVLLKDYDAVEFVRWSDVSAITWRAIAPKEVACLLRPNSPRTWTTD